MARNTRERLIQVAHDLFYAEGFHAVGLDRILDEVGVTKSTFYNHFAGKDELVIAALQWHEKWWQETFRRMLRAHGGDTPRGQLAAIPDLLTELFSGGDFNGCIFVNVSVEFPHAHDPAHQLAVRHKSSMEDLLREIAGYAGATDAGKLAAELSLLLEGAYVTRQICGSDDVAATVRRILDRVLDAHLPVAG